jgi:hypothetical protein
MLPIQHWRETVNHFNSVAGTRAGPRANYAMKTAALEIILTI